MVFSPSTIRAYRKSPDHHGSRVPALVRLCLAEKNPTKVGTLNAHSSTFRSFGSAPFSRQEDPYEYPTMQDDSSIDGADRWRSNVSDAEDFCERQRQRSG